MITYKVNGFRKFYSEDGYLSSPNSKVCPHCGVHNPPSIGSLSFSLEAHDSCKSCGKKFRVELINDWFYTTRLNGKIAINQW